MAVNMFKECHQAEPFNPVPPANMFEISEKSGNLQEVRKWLIAFLNSYQTGVTIDFIPVARQKLAEVEKQLGMTK